MTNSPIPEGAQEATGGRVSASTPESEARDVGAATDAAERHTAARSSADPFSHAERLRTGRARGLDPDPTPDAPAACSGTDGFCDVHGFHRHATAPDGLRERYAAAIRDAACTGDCGMTEAECARRRIQPEVWHRGVLAEVAGTPELLAAAVIAVRDDELLRLRAETATADKIRADVQRDRDGLLEQLAEARGQIERVRKAVTERRTELAEYEAEHEPSAWSDAVSVTCSRIEDTLRIFPESGGIPCTALTPKEQL